LISARSNRTERQERRKPIVEHVQRSRIESSAFARSASGEAIRLSLNRRIATLALTQVLRQIEIMSVEGADAERDGVATTRATAARILPEPQSPIV
jgi:hypothetical protein